MATFLLNWNPTKWQMDDGVVEAAIETTGAGEELAERWSVGVRTGGISWGDRCYLLRQHDQRGIVATGYFTSEVYPDDHWDGTDRLAQYADLNWTTWLPTNERLEVETLLAELPGVTWNNLQASGVEVQPPSARDLDLLWEDHLTSIGRDVTGSPDEVPLSETYREGGVKRVPVNRYERNPLARKACVAHHGTACLVCGLDFGAVYGPHGDGYTHVHHLRPLSTLPGGYKVDPVTDLVPVCPNCHAMLHRGPTTLTIAELRALLA